MFNVSQVRLPLIVSVAVLSLPLLVLTLYLSPFVATSVSLTNQSGVRGPLAVHVRLIVVLWATVTASSPVIPVMFQTKVFTQLWIAIKTHRS